MSDKQRKSSKKNDKKKDYKLSIVRCRDFWGNMSYFGLKNKKAYTEGFDTLEELKEQYPEFEEIKHFKGIGAFENDK